MQSRKKAGLLSTPRDYAVRVTGAEVKPLAPRRTAISTVCAVMPYQPYHQGRAYCTRISALPMMLA